MMNSIRNWFARREATPAIPEEEQIGNVAKKRLQFLLVHDRVQLSPGQMDALKHDLVAVLQRYVEIDPSHLDIALQQIPESRKMAIVSNIPVKRVLDSDGYTHSVSSC